ncbi:MAG: histidine kinase [Burkholderiaceae bacterium]|nr:histidine kinase [Burkholderiaceae bacterium]
MNPRRLLLFYIVFVAGMALLNSLAALQDYRHAGGTRAWEPFLWEVSSALLLGPLNLAVGWGVGRLRGQALNRQLSLLAAGFLAFTLLHVVGMFGLRFAAYGLFGVDYRPGPLGELLRYEGAKDLISYAIALLLGRGYWAWVAARQREQELVRLRAELAEARLARLVEQVQPHFLFNSLNLISSVMYEDVERADRLLCELATLLRQSLNAQQAGEHSLAEELALVRPFLSLMQARFGEQRLRVQIDAEDGALPVRMPALLLLAPVENAIKHDVATHGGPVTVRVHAALHGRRLQLAVENSGVQQPGLPDGGVGLANLRERLAARYGEAACVRFGPFDDGMRLRIELPG